MPPESDGRDPIYIIFLHAEDDLTRDYALVGVLEVEIGIQCETCRVLKDMSGNWAIFDHIGHSSYHSEFRRPER